jgi:hypothetical protein
MGNQHSQDQKVDHGQINTFGVLYKNQTYQKHVVQRNIIERRLAPFYSGKETMEDFENQVKEWETEKKSILMDSEPIECPICFLYYPKNINYTRCCDQPICTDCFLQIKRSETTFEPAECPYCVQPHFGIVYHPPRSTGYKEKRESGLRKKSIGHQHPSVVTSGRNV